MMQNNWDELPAEEKKRQIGELIRGPYWSRLPLQTKERWLDQLLACEVATTSTPDAHPRHPTGELS